MTSQANLLHLLGIREPTSARQPTSRSTEAYLKEVSLCFVSVSRTRNFSDSIFDHVSPHLTARHDAGTKTLVTENKEEFVASMRAIMQHVADDDTQVHDVQVNVNEAFGQAHVWLLKSAMGTPDGLVMELAIEHTWHCCDGKWLLTRYRALRAFLEYDSEALFAHESITE